MKHYILKFLVFFFMIMSWFYENFGGRQISWRPSLIMEIRPHGHGIGYVNIFKAPGHFNLHKGVWNNLKYHQRTDIGQKENIC